MIYTLLFLLCKLGAVIANDEFLEPPPAGFNVTLKSPFNIQWRCDDCKTSPITLNAWQDRHDGSWAHEVLLTNVVDPENYTWSPHTFENLTTANGFHFQVVYGGTAFDSGALFITATAASSTATTSSATLMQTSTVSPQTTTPTSFSSPKSSGTHSAATMSPKSNDGKLKIGLGVGLGFGIPVLLIGGIVGYMALRRRRRDSEALHHIGGSPIHEAQGSVSELRGDGWRHEMQNREKPAELQG